MSQNNTSSESNTEYFPYSDETYDFPSYDYDNVNSSVSYPGYVDWFWSLWYGDSGEAYYEYYDKESEIYSYGDLYYTTANGSNEDEDYYGYSYDPGKKF